MVRGGILIILSKPDRSKDLHNLLPRDGQRIVLRRMSANDLPRFQGYRSDPEVAKYQDWVAQSDEEALRFLNEMAASEIPKAGGWVQIAVGDRTTNTLIGDIGLYLNPAGDQAELGFTLHRDSQGRGFGMEAVALLLDSLFRHAKIGRVIGVTDARNLPSIRLLERLGMERVGTGNAIFRGEACLEHTYAITRLEAAKHWLHGAG